MNKFGLGAIMASAMTAVLVGLAAPAQAAPTGTGNALESIRDLETRGYDLRIVHQGAVEPLAESDIVSVRYDNADRIVHVTVR